MKKPLWKKITHTGISWMTVVAPTLATKIRYRRVMGRAIHLKNPETLNEKLQWLKLNHYKDNGLVTECADKYAVRNYVKSCGCEELLNDLYGVWDEVGKIEWDALPDKFVIKCNHGCGYNLICENKDNFNLEHARKQLSKWMQEDYGLLTVELSYKHIKKRILCEKYIETEDGFPPRDYKIFCSYGTPKLLYVITGGHGTQECLDYFTPDWKHIPVRNGLLPNSKSEIRPPELLEEMLSYASKLSQNFPIVRVDLYCEFGHIIFGELTFLPTGGTAEYNPREYDAIFGKMFPLYKK